MDYKERQRQTKRRLARKHRYGIEQEDFERMVIERDGKCDMCHKVPTGKRKTLCIDHDHSTGKIRGLLCSACNNGLGFLGDNVDIPAKVQQYLQLPSLPEFRKSSRNRKNYKRKVMYRRPIRDWSIWSISVIFSI